VRRLFHEARIGLNHVRVQIYVGVFVCFRVVAVQEPLAVVLEFCFVTTARGHPSVAISLDGLIVLACVCFLHVLVYPFPAECQAGKEFCLLDFLDHQAVAIGVEIFCEFGFSFGGEAQGTTLFEVLPSFHEIVVHEVMREFSCEAGGADVAKDVLVCFLHVFSIPDCARKASEKPNLFGLSCGRVRPPAASQRG